MCYNGVCQCRAGYSGEFCGFKEVDDSRWLYQFMVYALLIAVIGALFYGGYKFATRPVHKKPERGEENQRIIDDKDFVPSA